MEKLAEREKGPIQQINFLIRLTGCGYNKALCRWCLCADGTAGGPGGPGQAGGRTARRYRHQAGDSATEVGHNVNQCPFSEQELK